MLQAWGPEGAMLLSKIRNSALRNPGGGLVARATTPSERKARNFDTTLVAARVRSLQKKRSGRDRSGRETLLPSMEMSEEVCRTKSLCSLLRPRANADRPV